jgi:urease accessory protein
MLTSAVPLWHLLQLSDQFFPTGAYAFSHALEMYVAQGLLRDRTACRDWLIQLWQHAIGPCDLVFCRHAWRLAATQDDAALGTLDQLLTAGKAPRELRLESQHTGHALLRAAMVLPTSPLVARFFQQTQQGVTPGNHAIAFGIVAQGLAVDENSTLLGYQYNVTAGLVAAAARLVPLGQSDAQWLLQTLAPLCTEVREQYRYLTPPEAWSCTPGLDIRSMQHERLYSRLCRS